MDGLKEILFRLCSAEGTPGDEADAARAAAREFGVCARTAADRLGNLTAEMGGTGSGGALLLDAHLDRIGLIVTGVDENGFLHVDRCGGIDRRTLPGTPVTVCGTERLDGVVCCLPADPEGDGGEKISAPDRMTVDVGCTKEQAEKLVRPGDRILFRTEPKELLGGRVAAAGLDNRAGVAALIRCAQMLAEKPPRRRVVFLCSTREEVGGQGAVTGAYLADPARAIGIDVGFADQPGVPPEQCGKLGGGPMIGFAPVLDRSIGEKLTALAEKRGIPYKRDVMGGDTGTNCDAIAATRAGVPTGMVSVPLRYMHTPAEVVDLQDIENAARLLAEYAGEAEK